MQYFASIAILVAVGLFGGMVLCFMLGQRLAIRQRANLGAAGPGVGVVDGAVYGLLALLIGFSFSGGASRFDRRRELIMDEVNAIGTAWARIDLLPSERQMAIRDGFRRYLDARLKVLAQLPGSSAELQMRALGTRMENDVWSRAVAACLAPGGEPARMLLLPEMNRMFDIAEMERLTRRVHPPIIVYALLCVTALAAALVGGYGMANSATRNWFYVLGLSATVSVAVYVILELESPRVGLIRVDAFDRALFELREMMR